jgi:hypothetical protein
VVQPSISTSSLTPTHQHDFKLLVAAEGQRATSVQHVLATGENAGRWPGPGFASS